MRSRYGPWMNPISFKRYRFLPEIIHHAAWLYARFTLSFRDAEDLLAKRDIDVSNETVRRWFLKFGRLIAGNLKGSRRPARDFSRELFPDDVLAGTRCRPSRDRNGAFDFWIGANRHALGGRGSTGCSTEFGCSR